MNPALAHDGLLSVTSAPDLFYIFDASELDEKGIQADLTVANEHFVCYASDPETNIDRDLRALLDYKKAARNAAS